MNKSDPQDMALEALEALQKDLASASGDVRKELALMASVIDQKRAEEKEERESQAQETAQRSVQTMKTILVVDDDSRIRENISYALGLAGYHSSEAANGHQALEDFQKGTMDLVILDIELPDMTGLEVCQEIRKRDTAVPIIFITAHDWDAQVVKAFGAGGDDFVRKPFSAAELMRRVESALPDPTVTPKEAERESTPHGASVPTIEVQDKWGEHKPFSEQAVKTATEAFFYFVVLGPGLIFFLLMAALFYDFSLFSN